MKRIVALFVLAVFTMALTSSSSIVAAQEKQPHMTAALEHLREAQRQLEAASHDKGGHRVKAIALVKQAIAQVEEGIRYDDTHTPGR